MTEPGSFRPLALLVALLALLVGAASESPAQSQWQSNTLDLIVTNGSGRAWRPYEAPPELDGAALFASKVRELAAADPDALLLEQGGFTAPNHHAETAYTSPMATFFFETGFAAVNMSAVDFLHYGASSKGAKRRDPRHVDLFLSSLDHPDRTLLPLPSHTTVPTSRGTVELIALTDPDRFSGVRDVLENIIVRAPEQVLAEALATKQGPAIAFSDFPAARNEALAREWPALDVILEYAAGPAQARQVGRTLIIPRGKPWEVQKIRVQLDGDRRPTAATVERTPWISPEDFANLRHLPLPAIGMGVAPQERVAQRFEITQDNVAVDIHRNVDFAHLSTRQELKVYLLRIDDTPYRAIRVHHNDLRLGWMHFDVLGQIDPKTHTYARILASMNDFPVAHYRTRFAEA
ncbi:MAG: hypothetical protein KF858_15195, partial [Candidatus Sumerlaeia bacterium]|nr:hypothetical protein [Candidatus Sumerlaeia bacterium]